MTDTLVVLAVLAIAFLLLYARLKNSEEDRSSASQSTTILDITNAASAAELVAIAEDCYFEGEENSIFLEKAKFFESELDEDDWLEIYNSAQEGSDLEKYAEQRAGL